MKICVFCASSEAIDKNYIEAGERFGEMLAENGDALVFGAGKYGLMGALARGADRSGGRIIGVIPNFFEDKNVTYTHCELIKTETMRERKAIMEDISDGFVIMPGGIGTFEEFFEILTLRQLSRHSKPIAVYNLGGYYDPMINMMNSSIAADFMSPSVNKLYSVSSDPDEILEYIHNFVPFSYDKYEER